MRFYKDLVFKVDESINLISFSTTGTPKKVILAKGGDGGGARVVEQKTEPWDAQKGFLKDIFAQAQGQFNAPGPEFFPGQTYAGTAPQTEQALQGAEQRALRGSPLTRAAQDRTQDMLRPDFLTNNAAYNAALSANVGDILPQLQSQFNLAGGGRSGLARVAEQQAASKEAGRLMMPMMGMQQQAAQMAPGLADLDYNDLAKLAAVGNEREAIDQQGIDEARARHQFTQGKDRAKLADYSAFVQGNYGGNSTQTGGGPYKGNRLGSALGTGLAGAATGAMAGAKLGAAGGPWGAGIGGGVGLLSGLLS